MHFARHPLSRAMLAVATVAALAACKPSASNGPGKAVDASAAAAPAEPAPAAAPAATASAPAAIAPAAVEAKPVVADKAAKAAVIAAMDKFKALRRYRMIITHSDGPTGPSSTTVDHVAPDRFRVEATGKPTQVAIGRTLYATVDGRTTSAPAPAELIAGWRDPSGFIAAADAFTAEKGASRFVFAVPANEYKLHVTKPAARNISLWIGPKGLPVKLESQGVMAGKLVTTVLKFSHFDNPEIKVDTPK